MKKLKRAFTIVELVIVIAVIAILAAVLIPTFSNIIRKANVSSDTQLVRNLNTALAVDSAINGKHKTMHSALESAFDAGYDLEKINARANQNEILWDSVNDVFCYFDKDQGIIYTPDVLEHVAVKEYQYWRIVDAMPTDGKEYSLYASNKFSQENVDLNAKGFDAGNNSNIQKISYKNTTEFVRDVTIRTNGGTLTVDASTDTVRHYGSMDSLNIIAVANASYHENGSVKFMEIKTGRIVLETDSEVNHIHVNKNEAAQQGENAFASVTIAKATSVEMPNLSRDDVEIAASGTLVVALQEGTDESADKDYVWLTKQGVYEQIKVSNSETSAGEVWVNTSDKSEETKEAAQQIANNIASTITVGENTYGVTVDNDRDLILAELDEEGEIAKDEEGNVTKAFDVSINDEGQTVVTVNNEEVAIEAIEEVADKEVVQIGAMLFAGGTGTQSDPFLIADYDTFQHVSDLFTEGYYYFKVKDGIGTIDCKNWVPVYLNGSFDGNDVKLANVDQTLFMMIGMEGNNSERSSWTTTPVLLSDFTVELKCEGSIDTAQGLARNIYAEKVTYKSVKTTGTLISGSNGAIFFCYTAGNDCGYNIEHTWATVPSDFMQEIYVTDCSVETTIYAPSGSVGIIGGHYCAIGEHLKVVVNNVDSIFAGNYYNTSGKYNVMYGCAFAVTSDSTADPGQKTCSKISAATVTKGANSYTTTAVTNAAYIKVYISAQLSETGTPLQGITMTLSELSTIENVISGSSYEVLSTFNSVNYSVKQNNFDAYVSNATLYARVGGNTNFDNGSIKLVVLQYSSTGELLASKITEIANKANISSNWTIK